MKRIGTCLAAFMVATAVQAQDETQAPSGAVSIELNAAVTQDAGGCTMSFLVRNGLDIEIAKAVYETVLFDTEGQVERLTLFDFGTLPPNRPRVRQFTIPGKACETFGRVLVNGASTCEAGELGQGACTKGLELGSRTDIEVIG